MAADYLGFIERGENVPTPTIMLRLADALGVPPSHMLRTFDGGSSLGREAALGPLEVG